MTWWDAERCEAGLDALGHYHEKRDKARDVGLGPEHDWSSHSADAADLMVIVAEDHMRSDTGGPVAALWRRMRGGMVA